MKKISDLIKKLTVGQNALRSPSVLDDRELLCRNICYTLSNIIEDTGTTNGRQLVVWLACGQQIVFDQYNNKIYRDIMLTALHEHGFRFEQIVFKNGKPEAGNQNAFKIGENELEYLEVLDCDKLQPSVARKAVLRFLNGKICPLQKEYELSSEDITSGRMPAYNIGRGCYVQKNGIYRENHIVFDDSIDSSLCEHCRCVSRNHAHIGFDATKGFYFQVDEGGAYPGKTILINGGRQIDCNSIFSLFFLHDGDKIIVKNDKVTEVILMYNELNK